MELTQNDEKSMKTDNPMNRMLPKINEILQLDLENSYECRV